MSNFIKIPAQQEGEIKTSECVINLDTVFLIRSYDKNDDTFIISFLTMGKKNHFEVSFITNKEERDLWYNKIVNYITTEI